MGESASETQGDGQMTSRSGKWNPCLHRPLYPRPVLDVRRVIMRPVLFGDRLENADLRGRRDQTPEGEAALDQ
jgi:hypothetical protein